MEEQISISVTIGERQYPLKIRSEDEPLVRRAEHLINEKFNEFQLRFTGQEKIDYLAMSALMNYVELLKSHSQNDHNNNELTRKLSDAAEMINEALKK